MSLDGENYNGYMTYPTKKAAIEAGRKEFASVKNGQYSEVFDGYIGDDKFFYVALFSRPEPTANVDNIIEDVACNADVIYDEYCFDFLENVTEKQKEGLEKEINKVIQHWLDKHNLRTYGFLVENVEQVKSNGGETYFYVDTDGVIIGAMFLKYRILGIRNEILKILKGEDDE